MTLAAALGGTAAGGPPPSAAVPDDPATDIRAQTLQLLAADARHPPAAAKPGAAPAGGPATVVMAPYVLQGTRVPRALDPVPETRFQRFQDDGTLFHLVGRHVTTNVFLHFYRVPAMNGGTAAPASGVQLGVGFSW
jgi:hypothetical protein